VEKIKKKKKSQRKKEKNINKKDVQGVENIWF